MVVGLGIPLQKVETLTLGIDTKRFPFQRPHLQARSGPLRLICTRHLEAVYDQRTIITGMAILASQRLDFRLTFVGGGSLRERLRALAMDQGIGDKTTFLGKVPNSHLPELLADYDIYLSASVSDGTSLSLLEAMASGLYPVVSDISANRAWIKHGHNGLLHKVSDPQSLADSVLAVLRDPGQTGEALRFNRALVVSRGDRMANMNRLEEVYCKLALRHEFASASGSPAGAVDQAASQCRVEKAD